MNRACLAAAPLVLVLAAVAAADEYVVDAFTGGYVEPPPYPKPGETNPSSITRIVGAKQDLRTVGVTLPFQFQFFGKLYSSVSVSDDGWLAFGSTSVKQPSNPQLPSNEAPDAFVAALWDDLRTGNGEILTFVRGAAPDRTFVVTWQHVASARSADHDDLSFEVLLHEVSGVVEIAYAPKGKWKRLSYTAGIENETGTRAFGGPVLTNSTSGKPLEDQRFTPNAVTITGTVTRDRAVASASGLGSTTGPAVPVVGADVKLVREGAEETIATTRTDVDGKFTMVALGLDGAPNLSVDLFASGAESFVTAADGSTWKRRIAAGIVPHGVPPDVTAYLDATVAAADPNFLKALNIQQAVQRGFVWAGDAIDGAGLANAAQRKAFTRVEIRWTPGGGTASGYRPATSTAPALVSIADVAVASTTITPDAYDDDVVLREYAQHLLATISTFPGALNGHVWTPPAPPPPPAAPPPGATTTAAFVDGFSFWFAAAVQQHKLFVDTIDATSATTYDLEVPSPAASGANVAGAVAASLWDLVDPANEPDDRFEGTLLPTPASPPVPAKDSTAHAVFATLDQRTFDATSRTVTVPSGSASWTSAAFFDAWRAKRTAAETNATARDFIHLATLADDTFEPNDDAGEEKAYPTGQQRLTGLVLNAGNEDRFSFPFAGQPVAVAVSFSDVAEAEVSILDSTTLAVVATSASTKSPVVATMPLTASTGTYVARIAWRSGTAAHYTLSIYNPPVLKTSLPSEWTVGVAYSQTLEATGGVPPVTFALPADAVPGLALVGGNRISGTPTTPGTYVLNLTLTDSSGAGPLPSPAASLLVHESLTLARVFGVRSGDTVAVDVGRGGTHSVWSAVTQPPDPALALAGGDTLRLTGSTGATRWFTVSGSATDAVGATLATSQSTVVVCPALAVAGGQGLNLAQGGVFGFWFDAIAASRVTLDVHFTRAKTVPGFLTLVDDRGDAVALPGGALVARGGAVTVSGVVVPRTARYFLVFKATAAFTGKVASARARIRPPTQLSGVANIVAPGAAVDVPFTAIAGSKLRVVVRGAPVPDDVQSRPGTIEMRRPGGATFETLLTPVGVDSATVADVALTDAGAYVLRLHGAEAGSLVYEVVIVPPKKGVFSLD